ncbi:MAG: GHKL domain-containing protein [Lachnospiraceae bacterium]|nr:GHKL domain-containing protein [Lachnospiraceae bacterium]
MSKELYRFIYVFFSLFEVFCYYRLMNSKLTYRFPKFTLPITFLISCGLKLVCLYGNNLFTNTSLFYLAFILFNLSLCVIYKDSVAKVFSWFIVSLFLFYASSTFTIPITLAITGTPFKYMNQIRTTNALAIILSYILFFIVVEFLVRTKKKIFETFNRNIILIMLLNVAYNYIVVQFYHSAIQITTERAIILSMVVITLITILTIFLITKITKKSEEIMTNNLKMQQIEMEHKQNQDMAIIVEDLRALRHDMNNHMSILQGLLEIEELEDAKTYLSNITKELSTANSFIFTDNKILSVLLNNKISKAKQLGIQIEVELLSNTTPFSDSDLCAVVGNILENAIEAAAKHEEPYIYFSMRKENNQLLIQCDNTYAIAPVLERGNFVTTKADKAYHGIGTKTIRSVVEEYHGKTEFNVDEQFHVNVNVPFKTEFI